MSTTSLYGPPPDRDPRAKRGGDGPARPRGVLATLGLVVLGVACFVALVWLDGPGEPDGPDIDQLMRIQQRLQMPQIYDGGFTPVDLTPFEPLQSATLIPSSAIHPAEVTGATSTPPTIIEPLQSAGIISPGRR